MNWDSDLPSPQHRAYNRWHPSQHPHSRRPAMRCAFVFAMLPVVFLLAGSRAMGQKLPKADGKTIDLKITIGYNVNVMIELNQEGKLFRTREIAPQFVSPTETTFAKVKPGKYEVYFLAQSCKTFVKRVLLAEEDPIQTINVELNTNGGSTTAESLTRS